MVVYLVCVCVCVCVDSVSVFVHVYARMCYRTEAMHDNLHIYIHIYHHPSTNTTTFFPCSTTGATVHDAARGMVFFEGVTVM